MARNMDVTSANCELILKVEELYPSGISLQMFATDQSFSQENSVVSEPRMGVDGYMVAGYTPNIKQVTVNLEACSPSYEALAQVYRAMEANKRIYECTLVVRAPSLGLTWTWSKGVMVSGTTVPPAQKTFGPTAWVFAFESLDTGNN